MPCGTTCLREYWVICARWRIKYVVAPNATSIPGSLYGAASGHGVAGRRNKAQYARSVPDMA
eukprot:3008342-Rhodomonas_salina.2